MKKYFLLLLLLLIQIVSANEMALDSYSFHNLKDASPPKSVTILNHQRDSNGNNMVRAVLFTYFDRSVDMVQIGGDFTNWKVEPMTRGKHGVWFYLLPEYEKAETVTYKYLVNGIWTYDPENINRSDDGIGSYVSIASAVTSDESPFITYRIVHENNVRFVEFRTYQPKASFVSVAGDFNNWNPENDPLMRSQNGIWRKKIHVTPGTYRYKLIVDGNWIVDLYNEKSASDGVDGICSILEVPKN
jgi:1,4-alpha-glucan branching enzyme